MEWAVITHGYIITHHVRIKTHYSMQQFSPVRDCRRIAASLKADSRLPAAVKTAQNKTVLRRENGGIVC